MKREFFTSFHISDFEFYEGVLVFDKLRIGQLISLKTENDNTFDRYAVGIYYNESKLGYIPHTENKQIAKLLNAGYDCFEARIQWINKDSYPAGQIGIIVYLTEKK
jgi:hypothetical protein